jgi:hypothetical protein
MQIFEVGIVYRKLSRYYLAVSSSTLVTFKDGQTTEIRPYAVYDVVRSISVDELCERWGITLDQLDGMTSKYLPIPQDSVKPAPRGSGRARQNNDLIWKEIRSGRFSRP